MGDECQCEDGKVGKPRKPHSKPVKRAGKETLPSQADNSRPILEFPHFLRVIGPKHIKIMMQFVPSAITYSVTSLLLVIWMSEWKTVLHYLPYYNGKYEVEEKQIKPVEEGGEEA